VPGSLPASPLDVVWDPVVDVTADVDPPLPPPSESEHEDVVAAIAAPPATNKVAAWIQFIFVLSLKSKSR
jgi:hypothetical protein